MLSSEHHRRRPMPEGPRQITGLHRIDPDERRADPAGLLENFRYLLPSDMETALDGAIGLPENVRRRVAEAITRGQQAIRRDAEIRHAEGTVMLRDRQQELLDDLAGFRKLMGDIRTPDRAMDVTP